MTFQFLCLAFPGPGALDKQQKRTRRESTRIHLAAFTKAQVPAPWTVLAWVRPRRSVGWHGIGLMGIRREQNKGHGETQKIPGRTAGSTWRCPFGWFWKESNTEHTPTHIAFPGCLLLTLVIFLARTIMSYADIQLRV